MTDDDRAVPPRSRRSGKAGKSSRGSSRGSASRGSGKRRRPQRRSFLARMIHRGMMLALWGAIGAVATMLIIAFNMPQLANLKVPPRPPNIQIVDASGQLIANRGDTGGEAVKLSDLPKYLPEAVIATEDRKFYHHFGIDPAGLARAFITNITSGGVVQGGSTLTQQLAKNLFLKPDRTIKRKLEEVVLALRLEATYSKDQILEMYLNRVYMGAGAYGVDAASRRYFGKPAKDVNLLEAAILAGLLKAPSRYAPTRSPDLAIARASTVLKGMVEVGYITEAQREAALKLPLYVKKNATGGSGNYVADWVMDLLPGYVSSVPGDLVVTTTIDLPMQRQADASLYETLQKDGAKRKVTQGAVVSIDTTGAIKALVGGVSYADSQFDRAIAARRQPGSSFKPFVYLTALEDGMTPQTIREDAPISIKGWNPTNFERKYEGPVTLEHALADSINTVAIRLAAEVGPKNVIETAHRLGISSEIPPDLSIALGTASVTPLDMTAAYVPFANGGIGVIPYVIDKIATTDGTVLFQRTGDGVGRVVDPYIVGEMNQMLSETLVSGTGRAAALPGIPAAGKTGTSQDYRDAWFIGYTARLVTGVWVGNDDNSPTKRVTGGSIPAVIWHRLMTFASKGETPQPLPGANAPMPLQPSLGVPMASDTAAPLPPAAVGTATSAPATTSGVPLQQAYPSQPVQSQTYPAQTYPTAQNTQSGQVLGAVNAPLPPADIPEDVPPDGLPNPGPVLTPGSNTPPDSAPKSIDEILLH